MQFPVVYEFSPYNLSFTRIQRALYFANRLKYMYMSTWKHAVRLFRTVFYVGLTWWRIGSVLALLGAVSGFEPPKRQSPVRDLE